MKHNTHPLLIASNGTFSHALRDVNKRAKIRKVFAAICWFAKYSRAHRAVVNSLMFCLRDTAGKLRTNFMLLFLKQCKILVTLSMLSSVGAEH